ncbi:unnamed protein product, partial [Protopolystoma xenopodis]
DASWPPVSINNLVSTSTVSTSSFIAGSGVTVSPVGARFSVPMTESASRSFRQISTEMIDISVRDKRGIVEDSDYNDVKITNDPEVCAAVSRGSRTGPMSRQDKDIAKKTLPNGLAASRTYGILPAPKANTSHSSLVSNIDEDSESSTSSSSSSISKSSVASVASSSSSSSHLAASSSQIRDSSALSRRNPSDLPASESFQTNDLESQTATSSIPSPRHPSSIASAFSSFIAFNTSNSRNKSSSAGHSGSRVSPLTSQPIGTAKIRIKPLPPRPTDITIFASAHTVSATGTFDNVSTPSAPSDPGHSGRQEIGPN